MKRTLLIFLLVFFRISMPARESVHDHDYISEKRPFQSVGLVLSGGGAKGIAHIGVIQALEDHDIPIDYIAGTSMGAIVGGLYAAGYTPDEMMELLESPDFVNWSTGKINEKLTYYFLKKQPNPAVINITVAKGDSLKPASILPTSLISPLPMNFAFMELFSAYTAQCGGDFNNLFVPFRCVASDVYAKHKVVCSSGSLGDAIRASMSFPLVFHPIEIDGTMMYDGGIYDNFPVDVMRSSFAPSVIIGVDVSTPNSAPKVNNLVSQLEDMIIQNNDYSLPPEEGIKIRVDLKEFNLLDFPKARRIYAIGYEKAESMIDSICSRVTTRVPAEERRLRRQVFKSRTPYVRFDSVSVSGGTAEQNRYFSSVFSENHTDTFGLAHAKLAYYRAISGGKLSNLMPTAVYDDTTGLFRLDLHASVKDNTSVGFGGYITSSVNSMIFVTGGYSALRRNYFDSRVSAWIGQSYMAAEAKARVFISTPTPSSLEAQFVTWRMNYNRSDNLFYESLTPTALTDFEMFGRLSYGFATGRNSLADVSAAYGHLNYRYYSDRNSLIEYSSRNKSVYNAFQARARFERNTLNNNMFPSSGAYVSASGAFLYGQYRNYPVTDIMPVMRSRKPWWRLAATARNYFGVSRNFSLGIEYNLLYTTRDLFPYYDQSIATAEEFYPTPASYNTFNPNLRAFSYVTAGIVPVYKIIDNLQIRATAHCFMPFRAIKKKEFGIAGYGGWFADPSVYVQLAGVYNFPFASLSIYTDYTNSTSNKWSAGISFGLFFLAPKFF